MLRPIRVFRYTLCWKIDIEDQRRNRMLSGYEWWLIQDFWLGSNGILDTFQRPKPGVVGFEAFNAPSIFLQDGLELSYASNDTLSVEISLSNFGTGDFPVGSVVRWQVVAGGVQLASGDVKTSAVVPQGDLGVVASLSVPLPDAGTTTSKAGGKIPTNGPSPLRITVTAELVSAGSFASGTGGTVPKNSWNTTLFPRWVDSATDGWNLTVVGAALLQGCGFSNCLLSPPPPSTTSCQFTPGVAYPKETSGGDIPCLDAVRPLWRSV